MEKRKATFTVKVPIQITFVADDKLDCEELFKFAEKEIEKRLESGYFDVLNQQIEVVDKITHYSRDEIRQRNRAWQEFLWGTK